MNTILGSFLIFTGDLDPKNLLIGQKQILGVLTLDTGIFWRDFSWIFNWDNIFIINFIKFNYLQFYQFLMEQELYQHFQLYVQVS